MLVSGLVNKYGVDLTPNEALVVFMYESKEMKLSSLDTNAKQQVFLVNAETLGIDAAIVFSAKEHERIMEAVGVMYEALKDNLVELYENGEEEEAVENAESFAENAKEKMGRAANYMIKNVKAVGRILKEYNNFANMTDAEIEAVLTENGTALFSRIKNAVAAHGASLEAMKRFVNVDYDTEETNNVLDVFRDIVDNNNLNGWGKFKAIVKVLIRYLLKIIIYVLHVILKIAITVTIGLIKMSAVGLKTTFKTGKILKKEVADPISDSVKSVYQDYKSKKQETKETKEAEEYWADTLDESFRIL